MTPMAGTCRLSHGFGSHAFGHESLDHIAGLEVVVIHQRNTAFEAGLHFTRVVLEALERIDLAGMNQNVVAQQTNFVVAADYAIVDIAAGDAADLRNPEHVA